MTSQICKNAHKAEPHCLFEFTYSYVTFSSFAFLSLNSRISWKLCMYLHVKQAHHYLFAGICVILQMTLNLHTSPAPTARMEFSANCQATSWSLSWCLPTSQATPVWGRRRTFSHMHFLNLKRRLIHTVIECKGTLFKQQDKMLHCPGILDSMKGPWVVY